MWLSWGKLHRIFVGKLPAKLPLRRPKIRKEKRKKSDNTEVVIEGY
jgi:hypothetical protein